MSPSLTDPEKRGPQDRVQAAARRPHSPEPALQEQRNQPAYRQGSRATHHRAHSKPDLGHHH